MGTNCVLATWKVPTSILDSMLLVLLCSPMLFHFCNLYFLLHAFLHWFCICRFFISTICTFCYMHFCIDFAYVASLFLQFVLFVTCIFALILHVASSFLQFVLFVTCIFAYVIDVHFPIFKQTKFTYDLSIKHLKLPQSFFFLSFFKLDIFIKPNKIKRFQQIRITIGQRACKEVPLKMLLHISKTLNFGMPIN